MKIWHSSPKIVILNELILLKKWIADSQYSQKRGFWIENRFKESWIVPTLTGWHWPSQQQWRCESESTPKYHSVGYVCRMAFRIMNGRKLVEMTTSTLLKRKSSPCSSAVMSKYLQLRYGSGGHGGGGASELEEGETRPWNYLWQPSPYPETKEEREAAARKYVSTA